MQNKIACNSMSDKPEIKGIPIKQVVTKALMEVLQIKKISDKTVYEELKKKHKNDIQK